MDKNLCIIPARGGSKRIPRKNIKNFLGKPIIAYSIEAALNSNLFEEVMVSTDHKEIANVALNYGANIPFFRSRKNSDDFATTVDVLLEVINEYKKLGKSFENVCCLYPTAPFTTESKLKDAYNKLNKENLDVVFPIMPFGYPIQRSLKIENGKVVFFSPEYERSRSQDLEKAYHDAGQFYFLKEKEFILNETMFSHNVGGIIISEMQAQDIDNESDWKLAELKYELLQSTK